MSYTHTFKTLSSGKTLYKSTAMNTGGYETPGFVKLVELSNNLLRLKDDGATKFDMDMTPVTGDTVILKNASDVTTATYGVGGTPITNAALNVVFDPLFPKANTGSGGSGAANATVANKTAADALPRVANRFVLVAADETNNSDTSLYYDNGTTLKYLLTVPQ